MSPRRHTWILLGCLTTLVLLVAVPLGYLFVLQARFNSVIASYRAAGEPMSEAEFGWPQLAEEDDIAVGLTELARVASAKLTAEAEQWIDRLWLLPDTSTPNDNVEPVVPLTDEQRQAAIAALLQVVPAVHDVDAVLSRPGVRWPGLTDWELHHSQLGDIRYLASLLANDASLAAEQGDVERFVARVRQVHHIGIAIGTNTTLIGHLSGSSLQARAADLVLSHPLTIPPGDTRRLITLLTAEAGRDERITTAMRVERVLVANQFIAGYPPGTGVLARIAQGVALMEGPLALEQMQATRAALLAPTARQADNETDRYAARAASMATAMRAPRAPQTVLDHDRRLRTDQRLAAVLLAARLYHADHARTPDQLADLLPYGLPHIPIDPFDPDDQPLRYDPARGLVYSVARNRTDDGGNIANDDRKTWTSPDRGISLAPPPPPSPR